MFEVDPDTYRYFFSASAQVFAAIFAVVAIAYNFKMTQLNRNLEDLRREKIRKVIIYKDHWGFDELKKKLHGALNVSIYHQLQDIVWHLDDPMIDLIINSIASRCDYLIKNTEQSVKPETDEQSKKSKEDRVEYFSKIKKSIRVLKDEFTRLENKKDEAVKSVKLSIIIAAIMTCLSLFVLLLELYSVQVLVIACFILFAIAIIIITKLFIATFSQS